MNEYMLLMHDDARDTDAAGNNEHWNSYLAMLRTSKCFDGGSSIGTGTLYRKASSPVEIVGAFTGYLRVRARNLEEASRFLVGNPVFEAGGTVEIRELPRD